MHTRCWSACKQGVVFLLFSLPSWCQMPWWTYRFTLTLNTELSICRDISLYEKLSTPQNLPYLKHSLDEIPGEDCRQLSTIRCEWWNWATGYSRFCYVFDPLLSSARSDLLLVSDETLPMIFLIFFFLTFLLLNQEHSVNNKRSQSIQSVRHSKQTPHMWPHQKKT